MGQKSAKKIIDQIEKSKNAGLANLLCGLGIPLVGKKTANEIAIHFKNMESLQEASKEDLIKIEGIGEEMALSISRFFHSEETKKIINEMVNDGVLMSETLKTVSEKLNGKTFVITGSLPNYSREEIKEIIEKNGGKETSSVSKKTSYLIAGENPGSKLQKARAFGIRIIDEGGFFKILEEGETL